jgi:putative FmdB family regulatory protein
MPTYEYACGNCGHAFERLQSITASSLRKCDQCGKMTLKRLIGAGAGVIFKGSGFYQTDYRSENYKKDAKKATDSTAKKVSDTKSQTKDTASKVKPKSETKAAAPKS